MRRSLAITLAVLGAACLLMFPAASAHSQLAGSLSIYDSSGVGQGVVATFAVRPSIFDPLAQGGLYYTSTLTSSQGGGRSYSVSSQTFPGSFAIGAIGCAGVHGALWAQATYPETQSCKGKQEATLYKPEPLTTGGPADGPVNAILDHVGFSLTHLKTEASLGHSGSLVEAIDYALLGMDGKPIVAVEDFDLRGASNANPVKVGQETTVLARGVQLLDGGISIDTIRSTAVTSTNGVTATADASLTFTGVTVNVDGTRRRATIDQDGIHVTDPALDRRQRLGLDEQIEEGLAKAGIKISASSPTEIVEGPRAEASVGGLSIAVSGTVPSVALPRELSPVLGAILDRVPTSCLSDFGAPIPLCFGAGVVPGFGSEFPVTLQIASANAFSAAAINAPTAGGDPGSSGPFTPPGGNGPTVSTFNPPMTGSDGTTPAEQAPPRSPFVQRGPLQGAVAKLPPGALLWVGMMLFVVAVGVGLGPSLRHAGAP